MRIIASDKEEQENILKSHFNYICISGLNGFTLMGTHNTLPCADEYIYAENRNMLTTLSDLIESMERKIPEDRMKIRFCLLNWLDIPCVLLFVTE